MSNFVSEEQRKLIEQRRSILNMALGVALLPSFYLLWIMFSGEVLQSWFWSVLLAAWGVYYAALFTVWKCPVCRARLGNNPKATACRACGVVFSKASEE